MRYFGFEATFSAVARAGGACFLVFLLYPFMVLWDVTAYKFCFDPGISGRVRFSDLFFIRLAGEALNNITPFIDIGGEPLKIHLLNRRCGVAVSAATSATVVARTSLLISEAVFMLFGVILSFTLIPLQAKYRWELIAMLSVVCAAFFAFLIFQQKEWLRQRVPEIAQYYRTQRLRFLKAVFFNTMGWVSGGIEMYFFCRIINVDISVWQAVMVEALLQLVRTASFFVPGNLGVQEGGLAFFMAQMSYEPVLGVGLSLLKRFRQILWTAIGFMVWAVYQYKEAKGREVALHAERLLSFDTWLDRRIHRPIADVLAFFLSKTPVTPDQVTVCTLIPALLSCVFFAVGSFSFALGGVFFFYLWSMLDHADGSLARQKKLFSKYGQMLDDSCDNIATALIFLGIFLGFIRLWNGHDRAVLTFFFYSALGVNTLAQFLVTYAKRSARREAVERPTVSQAFLWKQKALDSLTGRDAVYFFMLLVLGAHLWGPTHWTWYSFVMGFFIISMFVISTVSVAEFMRKR